MNHSTAFRPDPTVPLTRRSAAALGDADLIAAMRRRDRMAWAEWDARFRAVLEHYAKRSGIPRWDAATCIAEVLETEGMRFAFSASAMPDRMVSYLRTAVRNRYRTQHRISERRFRKYAAAASGDADGVVDSVASEDSIRASRGVQLPDTRFLPLRRFAKWLEMEVSEDDRTLLAWIAEQVPRRQIAAWLGVSYEASKKRCTRLCARVQELSVKYMREAPPEDRAALDAFFARVTGTPAERSGDHTW
jgi:hypothetical protein